MPLDQDLALALEQYSAIRRRIGRSISGSLFGVPFFGGRDILQWIGRLPLPNVTALSEAAGITRGGASKSVAKLIRSGMVESYRLADNKKEVYYRLTATGQVAHAQLLRALDSLHALELDYIGKLPDDEKRAALSFLTGFMEHLQNTWPKQQEEGEAN